MSHDITAMAELRAANLRASAYGEVTEVEARRVADDALALVDEARRLRVVADDRQKALTLAEASSKRQVAALVVRDEALADIAEALGVGEDAPLELIVAAARGRKL